MEFKIHLTADRPTNGDLVLEAETPLSGVEFMAEVGACLRKSIDHLARSRHVTLGALATYEITVPQCLAIESGLFESSSAIGVVVENNLLANYIFYGATISQKSTGRPCYPYMHGEAVLSSYIDELQFLEDWANLGFPLRLAWDDGLVDATYMVSTPVTKPSIGCGGCTVKPERPPHHHHHHHKHPPKQDECEMCPPNMGHNKPQPPKDDCCDYCCDDVCCGHVDHSYGGVEEDLDPSYTYEAHEHEMNHRIPHSNVRPGHQHRPGPNPRPHHGAKLPIKKPTDPNFHFVC